MKHVTFLLLCAFGIGCTSTPRSSGTTSGTGPVSLQQLVGIWKMHQVIQSGKDVTATHDPHQERIISFEPDMRFATLGRPYAPNGGTYTLQGDSLWLDSDMGPEDDSQWIIKINGDTCVWQGFGTDWATEFQIVQIRKK